MKYNKPMILATTDAASTIMGEKGIGVMDTRNPQSTQHSVAAYQGDE
jgi:hypothetical protein